jgi:hypothetical protein
MDGPYLAVTMVTVAVLFALTYKLLLRSWFVEASTKKREEDGLFPRPPAWQQQLFVPEVDGVRRRGGAYGVFVLRRTMLVCLDVFAARCVVWGGGGMTALWATAAAGDVC